MRSKESNSDLTTFFFAIWESKVGDNSELPNEGEFRALELQVKKCSIHFSSEIKTKFEFAENRTKGAMEIQIESWKSAELLIFRRKFRVGAGDGANNLLNL